MPNWVNGINVLRPVISSFKLVPHTRNDRHNPGNGDRGPLQPYPGATGTRYPRGSRYTLVFIFSFTTFHFYDASHVLQSFYPRVAHPHKPGADVANVQQENIDRKLIRVCRRRAGQQLPAKTPAGRLTRTRTPGCKARSTIERTRTIPPHYYPRVLIKRAG